VVRLSFHQIDLVNIDAALGAEDSDE
jgi:hypothetical protein